MYCPECGNQNPDTAKFCIKCGYHYDQSQVAPTALSTNEEDEQEEPKENIATSIVEQSLKKTDQKNESPKYFTFKNPEKYQGIKGWLLLFVVSLVFLSPLIALYSLSVLLFNNQQLNPIFRRYPDLFTIALIEGLVTLGMTAVGAYAGILLWKKAPRAVYIVKKYLVATLIYGVLLAVTEFTLAVQYNLPPDVLMRAMLRVGVSAFYYLVWMAFFRNSKRVEVNFGKEAAHYQPLKWLGF